MPKYGKRCARCQVYFVASSIEEKLCPWCLKVEVGAPSPELYVSSDDIQVY